MKLKIGIISVWVCMLFMACYEDKGNYDLVDYNRIVDMSIDPSSIYRVSLGDSVKLFPVITWKYSDRDTSEAAFEYTWQRAWGDTISRERNLKYLPGSSGYFDVFLYVREKATGVTSRLNWRIHVTSSYRDGWLIASSKNNQPSLSYVRRELGRDSENNTYEYWTDFLDIYARLHSDAPLEPRKILQISAYGVDYTLDEVLIFQEGGKATVLNGVDFGERMDFSNDFMGSSYPAGFVPKDFRRGGYCDFTLGENGEVYTRLNSHATQMPHAGKFTDLALYFPGESEISHFFDILTPKSNFILMYDKLYKRFVAAYTSFSYMFLSMGYPIDIVNGNSPATFANILNLEGYKLLYCGDHTDGRNFVNILKEESTGKYLFQSYQLNGSGSGLAVENASQKEFAGSALITDNSVFYKLRKYSYLYFGEGSKLYFYDLNRDEVKLYTDFGSGKITHIMQDGEGAKIGVALDNGTFCICDAVTPAVLVESDPGKTGILHKITGLGEITSIAWKWMGMSNYTSQRYQRL